MNTEDNYIKARENLQRAKSIALTKSIHTFLFTGFMILCLGGAISAFNANPHSETTFQIFLFTCFAAIMIIPIRIYSRQYTEARKDVLKKEADLIKAESNLRRQD